MKRMLLICLAMAAPALLTIGCSGDDGGCGPDQGAALDLTTSPTSGQAQANGNETITVVATGRDENCKPFADGTAIEFRITDQEPADVGHFSNDGTTIVVTAGAFGTDTDISSTVIGTAKVSAFSEAYNLTAIPIDIEFTEPGQPGQCTIEIIADPSVIPADGSSTSTITATITSSSGGSMPDGTTVLFATTDGQFTENNSQSYETQTSNSAARATLRSEEAQETVRAEVTVSFGCDDGNPQSGKETVAFGDADSPVVSLKATRNGVDCDEVLADNVSTVDLTAEIFLPGGVRAGAGEEVIFFTEIGRFLEPEPDGPTYVTYTDDTGTATATFVGGNQGGLARVRASIFIDNTPASDEVEINVRQLGFVEFVSAVPEKLGVKGSGVNESSRVTFVVKDTESNPFPPGIPVVFSKSLAPEVTLDSPTDETDGSGVVEAVLNSGTVATTVTVTATATVGDESLQAASKPIAIVGAKPTSRNITFSCERFNVGGFVLDFVDTKCTVGLADRYSNKIGFATNVIFQTEAGSIDSNALTSESASNLGEATVTVTTGNPRPKDVSPVAGEPFIGNHNPRDGIVTIIVVTTGEEFFDDANGNGRYDLGEDFDDEAEPFVDKDDNRIRDSDEWLHDSNNNGIHDGPNGVWDGDTLIWGKTHMLWTGEAAFAGAGDCGNPYRYSAVCPDTFFIPVAGEMQFDWEVKDLNLNPLNTTLRVDYNVEGKGTKGVESPPLAWSAPDTLGGFVNPTSYWSACGGGFCGWFTVKGAPTDIPPPESGTVSLEATYNQTPGGGVRINETITISGTFE